jgi:hypothetical protein
MGRFRLIDKLGAFFECRVVLVVEETEMSGRYEYVALLTDEALGWSIPLDISSQLNFSKGLTAIHVVLELATGKVGTLFDVFSRDEHDASVAVSHDSSTGERS